MHTYKALAVALIAIGGCTNSGAIKNTAMNAPFFMSEDVTIERQRPSNPNTILLEWTPQERFYESLTIDYVSGMSQRAYMFEEANQAVYRPMLEWSLRASGLKARTNLAARYGLQVDFIDLDTDFIGADLAGKSVANYRIVDRQSGATVFEREIASNFVAIYPQLNEDDASLAYDISSRPFAATQAAFASFAIGDGLIVETINNSGRLTDWFDGPINEASQSTWNDAYQTYFWATGISAISGPAIVVLEQLNPLNYLSLNYSDKTFASSQAQSRFGPLSKSGLSTRNGAERARQVNAQILAQSISLFLIELSASEGVPLTHVLPCTNNARVEEERLAIVLTGRRVVTDDCRQYNKSERSRGFGLPTWR